MIADGHAGGVVATLPLRSLDEGKRRLRHQLLPEQRRALIVRLCTSVVRALRASGSVNRIGLVSRDHAALDLARELGLAPIWEEEPGLNEALQTASRWAEDLGAAAHLIVLPDLPLLEPADIRGLVNAAPAGRGAVLCPDRGRTGTNILLLRPCGVLPPMFGPQSFARHQGQANVAGIPVAVYDSPGTRWDVDTPEDLDGLELP